MSKRTYYFHIDEHDRIQPLFDRSEFLKELQANPKITVEILGCPTTSLIAIAECADFLDAGPVGSCEWAFTKTDSVTDGSLVAIINYL